MVTTFDMSKVLGPLAYQQGARPLFLGDGMPNPRRVMSEETAQAIEGEKLHDLLNQVQATT